MTAGRMVLPQIKRPDAAMPRLMLTDSCWDKLLKILLNTGRVYNKEAHRMTVEGMLFHMRVGCPWRDLPSEFGRWNTVYRRFNHWSKKGLWQELLNTFIEHSDREWQFIDGSIVKAHQHSAGAASGTDEGIGKSRGGKSTKIHMVTDSYGLPILFEVTGGEVNDIKTAPEIIEKLDQCHSIICDKGYDSEPLREQIRDKKWDSRDPPQEEFNDRKQRYGLGVVSQPPLGRKRVCTFKALQSDSHSLRQIVEKLCHDSSDGMLHDVAADHNG